MDTHLKSLLDHVIERLDKIQKHQECRQKKKESQLDHVMKRLDMIQTCLDRQNQKQNLLDEKLSDVTSVLEQETAFMREQLIIAQNEILSRLTDLREPTEDIAATNEVADDEIQTVENSLVSHDAPAALQNLETRSEDVISRPIENALDLIDAKTVSPDNGLADFTAERGDWINSGLHGSLQTSQPKGSFQRIIETPASTDTSGLNQQLNQMFVQFSTTVTESLQEIKTAVATLVEGRGPGGNHVNCAEICGTVSNMQEQKSEQIQTLPNGGTPDVHASRCDTEDLLDNLTRTPKIIVDEQLQLKTSVEKLSESTTSMKDEIKAELQTYCDMIKQDIQASVDQTQLNLQEATQSVVGEFKTSARNLSETIVVRTEQELEQSLFSVNTKLKQGLLESTTRQIQDVKKHVEEKLTHSTTQLQEYMYNLKREIFAVTEKEAQLIRDKIFGFPISPKSYMFDFYVEHFKSLINTGKGVHSLPWHIRQFHSSLQGYVRFNPYGQMRIGLLFARHPREVGLHPRSCGRIRCKATITDTSGLLPDLVAGEDTGNWDETEIKNNGDWGSRLGIISCDDLIQGGYGEREGYLNGAILVRYEIEVL